MHYFTIISLNYLPKARILARSLKEHNPGSVLHLVICDAAAPYLDLARELFDSYLTISDLDLPVENLRQWIFTHSVVEMCTAVKPQCFIKIFEKYHIDRLTYIDPDIVVYDSLDEVDRLLDRYSIILTPHQIEPDSSFSEVLDNEFSSLKCGTFNLGFISVKKCPEGMKFLKWWRERLIDLCYDHKEVGLFVDQKWIDLVPSFFEGYYILRDKAYNIANWNLNERYITIDSSGKPFVEGKPVRFYHFSGAESGAQRERLIRNAEGNKQLYELLDWYVNELKKNGQDILGAIPNKYSCFSNGVAITKNHRYIFRTLESLRKAYNNPFIVTDEDCYYNWYNAHVASMSS